MIALSIVFSAYCSEVLLSAFKAIPQGQYDAGDALGFHRAGTMRLIVLPQLIRISLPNLGNLWMNLLKDTSYVSIIGLTDIIRQTALPYARPRNRSSIRSGCLRPLSDARRPVLGSALFYLDRWARRAEFRR